MLGTSPSHTFSHSVMLNGLSDGAALRFGCTLLAPATGGYSRDSTDDPELPGKVIFHRPAVDVNISVGVAAVEKFSSRSFGLVRMLIGDCWTRCEGYLLCDKLPAAALVGPVIGRVSDSAACVLLEVDAECEVACLVVNVLTGKSYVGPLLTRSICLLV